MTHPVGTYPPAPPSAPEHTSITCQRNVNSMLGNVIAHTGIGSPTADDVSRAMEILTLVQADCRRWLSALHLVHAAPHHQAISRAEIDEAMGRAV